MRGRARSTSTMASRLIVRRRRYVARVASLYRRMCGQ